MTDTHYLSLLHYLLCRPWLTWGCWGPAGSCMRLPLFCSSPGRCESGSPCLGWLRGSSWSCSGSRAVPSAPFAQWRCDRGCWRGYSPTNRDEPASSARWTFACADSWCTHCAPSSGPAGWRDPAAQRFGLNASFGVLCWIMLWDNTDNAANTRFRKTCFHMRRALLLLFLFFQNFLNTTFQYGNYLKGLDMTSLFWVYLLQAIPSPSSYY